MKVFDCPYCGQEKNHELSAAEFCSCRFCGFKSALVHTGEGKLLIVDRRMPYLQRRCRELSISSPEVEVIVDRRIAQDPYNESERRIAAQANILHTENHGISDPVIPDRL